MSVMIGTKVKDGEIWLPRFITQVENLEGDISRIVIMYGESRDRTFAYLDHWRNLSRHKIEIYKDPYLPPAERHGAMLTKVKQELQQALRKGGEEYYLNLDCDLVRLPHDLIPRLMEAEKDLIAAMVWTEGRPQPTFFDTFIYRLNGCKFHPYRPPGISREEPIEVDSVSTCYLARAEAELDGVYENPYPHIPFCADLKKKGYGVWVHPKVHAYHIDLEKLGITRQILNHPFSLAFYITDEGQKIPAEQLGAMMYHLGVMNYNLFVMQDLVAKPGGNQIAKDIIQTQSFLNQRPLITASYKVLNESEFLEYSMASIYDVVDRIDIVEGAVLHHSHAATRDGHSLDNTLDIIKGFPDPAGKIRLYEGRWKTKEEIQAKLLEVCSSKWMLFIDGDEILSVKGGRIVREFCKENQDGKMIYARPEKFINFWHDFKHTAFSLNPLSAWSQSGSPHPFLIHRDIPGLNFGGFHTVAVDGFGNIIHSDTPVDRDKKAVLEGVHIYHFGNAKSPGRMEAKLTFEANRGVNYPWGKAENDPWFTGEMSEDMVIEYYKGRLPDILNKHPRRNETAIRITSKKPFYKFRRVI